MGIAVWRVVEKQKHKMAMGSICQIMDKARNWGKLSEMDLEWSPEAVKEAPRFRSAKNMVCRRSRGQEGPPEARFGEIEGPPASSIEGSAAWRSHSMTPEGATVLPSK